LAGFRQHLLRYRFLCWEKEHKKPTNKQTETQRVHRNTADRLIGTLHPLGANGQGPLPSVDPSRAGGQYDGGVAAGNNASVRRSSHITPHRRTIWRGQVRMKAVLARAARHGVNLQEEWITRRS
jgi:hypothetical protein